MAKTARSGQITVAILARFCQNYTMEISAEALGMARIGLGIERDEMAERLGVSVRTIANWERSGVPQHRVVLVMSKIGQHIRAAQDAIDASEWHGSPEGLAQAEALHNAREAELLESGYPGETQRDMTPLYLNASQVDEYLALQNLLSGYSTAGILREVMRRVGEAGVDSILAASHSSDPSDSQTSDRDAYDLAAHKGEDNINHDELPHEP